jgi:SAM-dependent methyltransferase
VTFFDRIAPRYDRTFAPDRASTAGDLERLLEGRDGVVLDLGCGTGRAFPHLIDLGFRVIGMDASMEMLREAKKRSSTAQVTLVRADLYGRWPIARVDIVLALHSVLAHPPSPEAWAHVGAEIRRVGASFVAIDIPEPAWAQKNLRRIGDDRYLFEDRDVSIEALIPDPREVVRALGLPLRLIEGPLGKRAITNPS